MLGSPFITSKAGRVKIFLIEPNSQMSLKSLKVKVSAGLPVEIAGEVEPVDLNRMFGKRVTVVVQADGFSMQGRVEDQDWLLIEWGAVPENGQVVLARVNDGYTLKEFRLKKQRLYLVPANPSHRPMEITEDDDIQILGVVAHVIRSLK